MLLEEKKQLLKRQVVKAIVENLPRETINKNRQEINEILEDVKNVNILKEHWHYG